MEKITISKGNVEGGLEFEVSIKGNGNDLELKKQAISLLISGMDLKHDFNSDYDSFDKFVEQLLFQVADVVGYESFYWDLPEEEKSYNEYDELIVSKKAKIELLEKVIESMKVK